MGGRNPSLLPTMRKKYCYKDKRKNLNYARFTLQELCDLMKEGGYQGNYQRRKGIMQELEHRMQELWAAGRAERDSVAEKDAEELFGDFK